MKQSVHKHAFTDAGINGSVEGEIVVTMNCNHKTFAQTTHRVDFYIDGALWKSADGLTSENMVLHKTETLIREGKTEMRRLAVQQKKNTFYEQLTDIFQKNA